MIYMPAMHDKNVLLEAESLIVVCHSSGSIEHKQHANACLYVWLKCSLFGTLDESKA